MAVADRRAIAGGTPEAVLVERAGRAVAQRVRATLGGTYGRRVVVVCGKGNNGADGRVAARVLRTLGIGVDVFGLDDGIDMRALGRALDRCDVALDAMFGTGFHGTLSLPAIAVDMELYRAPWIIAVDIPSGVDGTTGEIRGDGFIGGAVLANETVCFQAWKPGLLFEPGRFHAGTVYVTDIGIDVGDGVDTVVWTALDVEGAPLERWPFEHKWSSAVLVVGGSPGMVGAPMMAARAAARTGSGMVVAALPPESIASVPPSEIVVRATPRDAIASAALDDIERFGALVLGPGLGHGERVAAAVRDLVARAPVPVVLDADGLNALDGDLTPLRDRAAAGHPPAVLTPHAGEYARVARRPVGPDRLEAARHLATEARAVVLLKGPGTVVARPDGFAAICANGGSELATAGTGDVLSGMIGALVAPRRGDGTPAQIGDVHAASASAAWLHAEAARAAGNGPSTVASDVIAALPRTLEAVRRAGRPS
jgi:NAD(P)H-hydrate epimerase